MKPKLDPVTYNLNRFIWVFWGIIVVSLIFGVAQDDYDLIHSNPIAAHYNTTVSSTIVTVLLWLALIMQLMRQIYYSYNGTFLVKLGRGIMLLATSVFTFRMTYMLIEYDGVPSSQAALIALGLMAIGIMLINTGTMLQSFLEEETDDTISRWRYSWREEDKE